MKTFNNRRKIYSSNSRRANGSQRGSADSPYLSQKGNNNGYRRNNKNFKDQYTDYINKAKDAISNGDEILEQFYLQYAEHCFRQMEDSGRSFVSKKIDKSITEKESSKTTSTNNSKEKSSTKTDFDDLANQLA